MNRTCLTCQFFNPVEPGELDCFPEAVKLGFWPKIGSCKASNLPPWAARTSHVKANADASGCNFYLLNHHPIVPPSLSSISGEEMKDLLKKSIGEVE